MSTLLSKMFDVGDRDLPVPTSGNWVIKGCMTKWLRFWTFFENPKRWLFTIFWDVAHIFSNTDWRLTTKGTTSSLRFKLAFLTFRALHTGHPPYLVDHLQYHKPTRSTRSSASHFLSIPLHNLSFSSKAFHISAPKIWISLSPEILPSQTLSSFRRHLKTDYFKLTYPAPSAHPQWALILSEIVAIYKSFTYLFTCLEMAAEMACVHSCVYGSFWLGNFHIICKLAASVWQKM